MPAMRLNPAARAGFKGYDDMEAFMSQKEEERKQKEEEAAAEKAAQAAADKKEAVAPAEQNN